MCYNSLAQYYDKLMADVDYSWWVKTIKKYLPKGCRVLDVGCGTGTLSLALAKSGYDVTGLDKSCDMLVVASTKAKEQGMMIDFIQRDMRELTGLSGFDCVLIAVDSLNYLTTEADVKQTFTGVNNVLNDEGLFVFDIHTPDKMTETFKDYLYVENSDDLAYIWHVEAGQYPLSVVHELTIFAKNEDGSYNRSIEYHHQRTFEIENYKLWLKQAGFEIIVQTGDIERQLFVARKLA